MICWEPLPDDVPKRGIRHGDRVQIRSLGDHKLSTIGIFQFATELYSVVGVVDVDDCVEFINVETWQVVPLPWPEEA